MKKLYTLMLTALTALTFTACEDEYIADTLEGTWSGTMFVSTYYDGRDYYATHSEITFSIDPFRFTKGSGYWVDYYSGAPWDYVANHISWRVDNGNIYVHFREDDTSVVIADYHLSFLGLHRRRRQRCLLQPRPHLVAQLGQLPPLGLRRLVR